MALQQAAYRQRANQRYGLLGGFGSRQASDPPTATIRPEIGTKPNSPATPAPRSRPPTPTRCST